MFCHAKTGQVYELITNCQFLDKSKYLRVKEEAIVFQHVVEVGRCGKTT